MASSPPASGDSLGGGLGGLGLNGGLDDGNGLPPLHLTPPPEAELADDLAILDDEECLKVIFFGGGILKSEKLLSKARKEWRK